MTMEPPSGSLGTGVAGAPPAAAPPEFHPPATAPRAAWRIEFRGTGVELLVISIVNAFLSLITLGIWFAWGRVRVLQFLARNTWVAGDPLSFHGRGGELFRGLVLAFLLVILPFYVVVFIASRVEGASLLVLAFYPAFLLLIAFASVSSLRYRLPRTEWRGIRFGFDGKPAEFLAPFVGRFLLVFVTLGLYYPVYACWRRQWIMERCRFGTERFTCDAEPSELYGPFVACYFLGFVTVGWSWVWYVGHQQAYLWNHTRLGASRFTSGMTGSGWLVLNLVNAVLAIVTLGIAAPWIVVRLYRYFLANLSLDGALDLAVIRQQLQRTGTVGQGALEALDVDSGLDLA